MKLALGIDGGGTRSTAVLVDSEGRIVSEAHGGPMNLQVAGIERVMRETTSLVALCSGAGPIDALCLGLSGAGRSEDRGYVRHFLEESHLAPSVDVISDACACLFGAHRGREGIVLIAGTGSIAIGMDHDGRTARSGGWGYLLDDAGSGYDIGRKGVVACLRSRDGRAGETVLSHMLLRALNITAWEEVVRMVHSGDTGRTEIAALAPMVFQAAREGDGAASGILAETARELALLVEGVARQLGLTHRPASLALSGGIWSDSDLILPQMMIHLHDAGLDRPRVTEPAFPPAYGAAVWGLRQVGVEVFD